MLQSLKNLSEIIQSIQNIAIPILTIFIILNGFARRQGKKDWLYKELSYRKSIGIPVLKLLSKTKEELLFWKDPALIKGGILAAVFILAYFGGLIFMLFVTNPTQDLLIHNLIDYSDFANVMTCFINVAFIVGLNKRLNTVRALWWMIILAPTGVFNSLIFSRLPTGLAPENVFLLQTFMLFLESCGVSYTFGIIDATQESYIHYLPLVQIETTRGDRIDGLRFYSNNETEYHFIDENGGEHIMPITQVYEIKPATTDKIHRESFKHQTGV